MAFKQGESVEVTTEGACYKGTFINDNKDSTILKLPNGYNIGISKRNIKEQKSIGKAKEIKDSEPKPPSEKKNSKLPSIALLHTGGTIASKVDYETGAVVAKFTPEDIMGLFPELKKIANIESKLIGNLLSENIRFSEYNLIAKAIEEEINKGTKGIIVTHGTDTLHYTAAAISFILENLSVPVVLVGSQRSSDRPSSDSAVNLISAALFITNAKMPGVFICMHESMDDDRCVIIEGVNARKMHTSRRDAFKAINKGLVAKVDYNQKKIDVIRIKKENEEKLMLKPFDEKIKVGLIKSHPNMMAEELKMYESFDGLVIEGTGLGHIGIEDAEGYSKENSELKAELAKLSEKIPVAMASQAIYGRVNMNVYSTGREELEMGLIGNYCDMTPETAFIKLAWLLSNYKKKEEIKIFYEKNLCGEISERSEKEGF